MKQSAWITYSSETESYKIRFHYKEWDKCETPEFFYNWLVGFTDGDGCFNIYTNKKNNKINLSFKISQKSNNIQVLHYIKKQIGAGIIRSDSSGMSHYLVRDKKLLISKILPIFNKYPLLTKKRFNFIRFKNAIDIWQNTSLSQTDKIKLIDDLPLYNSSNNEFFITKPWIVGFVEADASFYLTKKDSQRIVHGFEITQKEDPEILQAIKILLKIKGKVKYNKNGFYSIGSTSYKTNKYIKDYFFKTMKSRKSLDYRIWARTFKYRNQFDKLLRIQQLLRKIRVKV